MVSLSSQKTQVVCYARKKPQSLACAYQYINGVRVEAKEEAKFLGVTIDSKLTFKTHRKETLQKLKTRTARFTCITGSPMHPRASTETSVKILRSMIMPVTSYAPTIAVMFPNSYFEEQDTILVRAARKALHVPKTISRDYVLSKIPLKPSREITFRNAANYINSDKRAQNVKTFIEDNPLSIPRRRRTFETPLDKIILSQQQN